MSSGYSEADDIATHRSEFQRMQSVLGEKGWHAADFGLVLDVGGGAGMHSAFLTRIARRVICSDFHDQNARFGGQFIRLLGEKFERNGEPFDIRKLEFHAGDATGMIYKDAAFDLVVSINALEHIPHPQQAVREVVRVLKPGAVAYLSFDPIWTCDTGSHFFHRVPIPWQHLLSDDEDYAMRMRNNGSDPFEVAEFRGAMNRVRLKVYRDLFLHLPDAAELVHHSEWRGTEKQEHLAHPNYKKCLDCGYSEDELLVRGMCALIRKRG